MPNAIATTSQGSAPTSRRLPNSVERALADALSLEHPDVPWSLPKMLPSVIDLRGALEVLTVASATPKHVAWCLAKLTLAFEPSTRMDAESTRLRAAVWLEANADLGDELWSRATLEAIRSSKWMPKPAELRGFVATELAERAKKLERCKAMLKVWNGERPSAPAEQPIATRLGRLEHTRSIFARMNRTRDVERIDREIAKETGQPVPASNEDAKSYVVEERAPFVPDTSASAKRCAELAEARRTGKPTPKLNARPARSADDERERRLEHHAVAGGHQPPRRDEPPLPDDIPEVDREEVAA